MFPKASSTGTRTLTITMKFTTSAIALLSLALGASSAAIQHREVFVPKVLYPRAGIVWGVKERHNVTWDISNIPTNISNRFSIRLNKEGAITPLILAQDFDPRLGRVEITVPWVIPGNDYQITLFGDSGNQSPKFTIQ